jgi:hypothetical protein
MNGGKSELQGVVPDLIETTLEKERTLRSERGEKVFKLIPLDLDGYLFSRELEFWTHARETWSRVAADFQGWETEGFNFDEQVGRVIRALRADEGHGSRRRNLYFNKRDARDLTA